MEAEQSSFISVYEGADLEISNRNVLPFRSLGSLGQGGCASVEKVQHVTTGSVYAHKVFRRFHGRNVEKFKLDFRNEVNIIRRLASHPHIVRIFATYTSGREVGMILTPLADGGDLAHYLQDISDSGENPSFDQHKILQAAFGCLSSGLEFIHEQTIRHKDIKPQNILVHRGLVLYTDFGLALDASLLDGTTTTGKPDAFTRRYCAPEVADWNNRNRKSDIFSLGCVFLEILAVLDPLSYGKWIPTGPFHEVLDDLKTIAISNYRWEFDTLFNICLRMLEREVDSRISAKTLSRSLLDIGSSSLFCPALRLYV
jgi:serine/threonine protein kinase